MIASKKFLSLPIISLKEGQQMGFVCNLVINPAEKCVAALVVTPKGPFKEQRFIPFTRVQSVGSSAITINTETQVAKPTDLPEILNLVQAGTSLMGLKVMSESGKILGSVEEFYINPQDGKITCLDIASNKIDGLLHGKSRLYSAQILTLGSDLVIVAKECDNGLEPIEKGLNDNVKSFFHTASEKAAETSRSFNQYLKKSLRNKQEETQSADPDATVQDSGKPDIPQPVETSEGEIR